ncbi:unnamed protein product [Mytilus edulis]|uniref:Uncharacterized protein n=1 Tax=Mytilus edulis TaxID=6550 RepID=A0A8S3UNG5_MYTED|nr:unnamed protein product [Mytilus edulis]
MDEEPSTSSGIKRHIPQELQDDIDLIAAKRPHEEVKQIDLDDNQKRHLVVGICLQSVLTPALRKYVHSIFTVLYSELVNKYKIDTQIYPTHLQKDPNTEAVLNYEAVNNNKAIHDKCDTKYDYTIKNAVELSKLFLETHKTHYEEFDKTLNSFALLELIVKLAGLIKF